MNSCRAALSAKHAYAAAPAFRPAPQQRALVARRPVLTVAEGEWAKRGCPTRHPPAMALRAPGRALPTPAPASDRSRSAACGGDRAATLGWRPPPPSLVHLIPCVPDTPTLAPPATGAAATARIVVQGRNIEATPAIKSYCEDKVANAIKHFDGVKEVRRNVAWCTQELDGVGA